MIQKVSEYVSGVGAVGFAPKKEGLETRVCVCVCVCVLWYFDENVNLRNSKKDLQGIAQSITF